MLFKLISYSLSSSLFLSLFSISQINSQEIIPLSDKSCKSQVLQIGPYEPICGQKLLTEDDQECLISELSNSFCIEKPCQKIMKMRLSYESKKPEKTCCRRCTCYGDPHCESFNGSKDTLVLCDGRVPVKNKEYCRIDKTECSKQKDMFGQQCLWKDDIYNSKGQVVKWNVGLYGSQCIPDPNFGQSSLLMYSFNKGFSTEFSLDLILGERGVITELQWRLSSTSFKFTAEECFNPDYDLETEIGTLASIVRAQFQENTKEYILVDKSGIQVKFTCIRNYDQKTHQYGNLRFNIDSLLEPDDPSTRSNPKGFCITDSIDKGLSSSNKKALQSCSNNKIPVATVMTQELCGLQADVNTCVKEFCKGSIFGLDRCVELVQQYDFQTMWCAYNVLGTQNPENCVNNDCSNCVSSINSDGFSTVISAYSNVNIDQDVYNEECLSMTDLEAVQSEDVAGVELQYYNKTSSDKSSTEQINEWITYMRIPYDSKLCDDIIFNSKDNPELFFKKIRIKHCPVESLRTSCSYASGYSAKIEFQEEPKYCPCEGQVLNF